MWKTTLILFLPCLVCAQEPRWQSFNAEMNSGQYEDAVRANQQLVGKRIKGYVSDLNIPSSVVGAVGFAGQALAGSEVTLYKGDYFSMNLDNVTNDDKALSVNYSLEW